MKAVTNKLNKWGGFLGDYYNDTTRNKIALRDKLEKAEYKATHLPVPPKPDELLELRKQLETQLDKKTANETMKRVTEASYAFWKR